MSIAEYFAEGDLWGPFAESYGSVMSMDLFIGVVFSIILATIYINSRSVVLTAITAMLSGGVIVNFFPPEIRTAGFLLIFVGVAAAGTGVYLGRTPRIND